MYFYKTGVDYYDNIILYDKLKSMKVLDTIQRPYIYTDIINKPSVFNRAKLISNNKFQIDFSTYPKEIVEEYNGVYGKSFVYKILLP